MAVFPEWAGDRQGRVSQQAWPGLWRVCSGLEWILELPSLLKKRFFVLELHE
jgi:hypothetical protein